MPISKKLIKFLGKAKYEPIEHKVVYTAFDKAQTMGVPEKTIGKTLVMRTDKEVALVLIPANKNLDIKKFKKVINTQRKKLDQKPVKKISFVKESWMKKNLKGIKVGATPPFGNLWGLVTFADKLFLTNPKIVLSAGDYNQSIKISSSNFKKLIPDLILGSFGKSKKA